MKKLALCFLLTFLLAQANFEQAKKSSESFFVTVKDQKITVVSPSKKTSIVTVVVKNETFDKIISEIKTRDKTLKRFALQPSGSKGSTFTLTVDYSKIKSLFYVSVAPPFQEAPLIFSNKGTYEIP